MLQVDGLGRGAPALGNNLAELEVVEETGAQTHAAVLVRHAEVDEMNARRDHFDALELNCIFR